MMEPEPEAKPPTSTASSATSFSSWIGVCPDEHTCHNLQSGRSVSPGGITAVADSTAEDERMRPERRKMLNLIALMVTAYGIRTPDTRGADEEAAVAKAKAKVKTKVPLDHYTFAGMLCGAEDLPPKLDEQIKAVQKAQKMLNIAKARELKIRDGWIHSMNAASVLLEAALDALQKGPGSWLLITSATGINEPSDDGPGPTIADEPMGVSEDVRMADQPGDTAPNNSPEAVWRKTLSDCKEAHEREILAITQELQKGSQVAAASAAVDEAPHIKPFTVFARPNVDQSAAKPSDVNDPLVYLELENKEEREAHTMWYIQGAVTRMVGSRDEPYSVAVLNDGLMRTMDLRSLIQWAQNIDNEQEDVLKHGKQSSTITRWCQKALEQNCEMVIHRPSEFSYEILRTLTPADQVTTLSAWIARRTSRHCNWMEIQVPTGYENILKEFWHSHLTQALEKNQAGPSEYFYNEVERLALMYKEHDTNDFVQKIRAETTKHPDNVEKCLAHAKCHPANMLRETGHIADSRGSAGGTGGSSLTATEDRKTNRWGNHWDKYQSRDDDYRGIHARGYRKLFQENRPRSHEVWPGQAHASQMAAPDDVEVDPTVMGQIKQWHPESRSDGGQTSA